MGRRSRKRTSVPLSAAARADAAKARARAGVADAPLAAPPRAAPGAPTAPPPSRAARNRSRREAAPAAPWGSFPLVELSVLAAIGLGVWGIVQGGREGLVLLAAAALLGSVAGLEVSIREHLGGYRSHTIVLSLTLAIAVMAALFFSRVTRPVPVLVGVGAFAVACLGLRALYGRRAGRLHAR